MKFEEWFNTKLIVSRFPLPDRIRKSDYKYIINVSDEYINYCHDVAMECNIKYFWFPMNECVGHIGINSLYGALQILYEAEQEEAKVMLHCHAGANRSPTVADAYYFMRTKQHFEAKRNVEMEDYFDKMLGPDIKSSDKPNLNSLQRNMKNGFLPSAAHLEKFLILCERVFEKDSTYRGGCLDKCKLDSGISLLVK